MTTIRQKHAPYFPVIGIAVALAMIAGLAYVLIVLHVLSVGNLQPYEEPSSTIFIAAASYFLGGLLILTRSRWLWVVGAVINALVILFFFGLYQDRPEVLLSPGGLVSKAAQILLELSLLYLITADSLRARHQDNS